MKLFTTALFTTALLLTVALSASGQNSSSQTHVRVPDAATAIAIARPAAIHVYGKKKIDYEEPLNASIKEGVWSVYGTLCCPDRQGRRSCEVGACVGGVVIVRIRQSDGRIMSITHGK
jgi:hypothetical protein